MRRNPLRDKQGIVGFGSVPSHHEELGKKRTTWIFIHTKPQFVLLTAYGLEHLTPDDAIDLARRLMNAAKDARNRHSEEP